MRKKRLAERDRVESHKRDALALKHAVWYGTRRQIFVQSEIIAYHPTLILESPFPFFDRALVPPVIRVNPTG